MRMINEINQFTKTIASIKPSDSQYNAKDIVCSIAAMLRTISAALPPGVPIIVKSLIIMAATILEGICELLPNSQKN
jgi:hypothetical protein